MRDFEGYNVMFEADFQVQTQFERELVERLAWYTWCLRRVPIFEAAYMQFLKGNLENTICLATSRTMSTKKGISLLLRGWLRG